MLYTFFHRKGGFQIIPVNSDDGSKKDLLHSLMFNGFDSYEVVDLDGKTRVGFTKDLLQTTERFCNK